MKTKQHSNTSELENRKELKNFEEGFLKIFDANPIGMIISNLETTKFQYVNEIFLTSFGYSKAEVIGKTAIELNLIEPESNEKVLSLLHQQGFAKDIEVLGRKKNGEIIWTLASVQIITINNEKFAITSFLNIAERKKVETELIIANKELEFQNKEKEKRAHELVIANTALESAKGELVKSNERFLKIFYSNPLPSAISNVDDEQFIFINDAAEEFYKLKREKMIGKTSVQLNMISETKRTPFIKNATNTQGVSEIRTKLKVGNGEVREVIAFIEIIELDNKKCAFASIIDITEQKKAEAKLKQQSIEQENTIKALKKSEKDIKKLNEGLEEIVNERTSELVNSNKIILDYKFALDESCIVAVTNQKGEIQLVNDNFCEISKYTRDELIGQDHQIINSKHHDKKFIRDLWVTIAKGHVWRGEMKNKAKDGAFYWVDTTIVPFLNEDRKPYKYLAIRSDITQRKQAKEHIIKLNEELEEKIKERTLKLTNSLEREKELNEIKTRFVSFASHEFRTPLTSILSSATLIEMYNKPEQGEQRLKHVKRISSSVKNLTDILDEFLIYGEIEHGVTEIKSSLFDLPEFIMNVVQELNGMVDLKKQKIIYNHGGELMIEQSSKILKNILLNLLSNASKYSLREQEILVYSSIADNKVSISVKDYGIGIPEKDQKKLFDQFFRAENAEHIQGTGLGLTIVKKYLELIKGNIELISNPGEGTTGHINFYGD